MKNLKPILSNKNTALAFTVLLIFAIATHFLISLFYNKKLIQKRKYNSFTQASFQATQELQRRWTKGDLEGTFIKGELHCPQEIGSSRNVDEFYLRCNPNYLQCFFQESKNNFPMTFKFFGKTYHAGLKAVYSPLTLFSAEKRVYQLRRTSSEQLNFPRFGILVNLIIQEFPEFSTTVFLAHTCNEIKLPERVYSYGASTFITELDESGKISFPKKIDSEWRWDNFGRKILIDKNPVTNRDIIEWASIDQSQHLDKELLTDRNSWSLPASNLTKEKMEAYCQFRGKKILDAVFFDAATFYPPDKLDLYPEYITRGPYPWTDNLKLDFFHQKKATAKNLCSQIYTEECLKNFELIHFQNENPSWTGINQTLGGYLEYMENSLAPKENLKASSFYFSKNSPWHQLGLRAYWDGKGFLASHFDWTVPRGHHQGEIIEPEKFNAELKVAFRCYQEVYP